MQTVLVTTPQKMGILNRKNEYTEKKNSLYPFSFFGIPKKIIQYTQYSFADLVFIHSPVLGVGVGIYVYRIDLHNVADRHLCLGVGQGHAPRRRPVIEKFSLSVLKKAFV